MNPLVLTLYAPVALAIAIAYTLTDGSTSLLSPPIEPLRHLGALVFGLTLFNFLPTGRPASLRAGERSYALSVAYMLGVTAAFAGMGTIALWVSAAGLYVLRRLIGPGAMIPGRAPAFLPTTTSRVISVGAFLAALAALALGYSGALAVVAAVGITAEALRGTRRTDTGRWILATLIGIVACQANPYMVLGVVATLAGGSVGLRRADRRGLVVCLAGAVLLAQQGFGMPALTLVLFVLAFAPGELRRELLPLGVLSCIAIALFKFNQPHAPEFISPMSMQAALLIGIACYHLLYEHTRPSREELWLFLCVVGLSAWMLCMPQLHAGAIVAGLLVTSRWNLLERHG